MDVFFSNQIARYDNGKCVFEINNKLNPASPENAYKIHAGTNETYENKIPIKSVLEFCLFSYKQTSEKKKVTACISPNDVRWLWGNIEKDEFGEHIKYIKVHSFKKNEKGLSPTQQISIMRELEDANKEKYKLQWLIRITNGQSKSKSVGVGYEPNSFVVEDDVYLRLSHRDMFNLISQTMRFLDLWECVNGAKLLKQREKIDVERRETYEQNNKYAG